MPTTGAPAAGSHPSSPRGASQQRRPWLSYGRPVALAQTGKAAR
jgi:hypothetical protein